MNNTPMKGIVMIHVYEFEVFKGEQFLIALPFDFEGGTQGTDMRDLADSAADWLRLEIEHRAINGAPLPTPTFDNEPRHGGRVIWVAVDAGLHTVPRVTAAEAARMLGVSPSRVSHMIRDGLLDAFKHGHNTWVTRYSVEARLKERPSAGRPKRRQPADEQSQPLAIEA